MTASQYKKRNIVADSRHRGVGKWEWELPSWTVEELRLAKDRLRAGS